MYHDTQLPHVTTATRVMISITSTKYYELGASMLFSKQHWAYYSRSRSEMERLLTKGIQLIRALSEEFTQLHVLTVFTTFDQVGLMYTV